MSQKLGEITDYCTKNVRELCIRGGNDRYSNKSNNWVYFASVEAAGILKRVR